MCDRAKIFKRMSKNVYVGNLALDVKEETLREVFERCGVVEKVRLPGGLSILLLRGDVDTLCRDRGFHHKNQQHQTC